MDIIPTENVLNEAASRFPIGKTQISEIKKKNR